MTHPSSPQAERLYWAFSALVRSYQFRDRNEIGCHGISVSQCHAMEMILERGPLAMGELAKGLRLDLSSMTRVVDGLVQKGLVERAADPDDRRICLARLTRKGRALTRRIRAELIEEHARVLEGVPASSRDAVIVGVERLLEAFRERQARTHESIGSR